MPDPAALDSGMDHASTIDDAGSVVGEAASFLDDPSSRYRDGTPDIEELVRRDRYPLPSTPMRVHYYGERHLDYWISGLWDYRAILRTMDACGARLEPGDAVLDFGCSSGRVLRHFWAQFPHDRGGALSCWGVDVKQEPIQWMRRHLDPSLRVLHTGEEPPLPIGDGQFVLIYAFSVFTHIDEQELLWIAELHRLLRSGGIAYLTVHTERTWELIGREPHWPIHGHLTRDGCDELGQAIVPTDLERPMPRERLVHLGESSPVPRVFMSQGYIRREWGRFFEVVDIIERGSAYHDVAVLRKSDT